MKTPITPIRIPLDIKYAAAKKAMKEGSNLSKKVIELLTQYLKATS